MSLWVPPKVARELVESRLEYQADIMQFLDFSSPLAQSWKRELSKLDPFLAVGKAAEEIPAGFALEPGFWHLVRINPHAPPTTEALKGRNGEYIEPAYSLLERLRGMDLQNPRVMHDRVKAQERANREQRKRVEESRAQRREELFDRTNAAWRTQVLVSDDVGWTQSARGRKEKK